MIVLSCPGQGSQTPGFLAEWLKDEDSKAYLSTLSDAAGVDLIKHGTESDADTIRNTAIAQPLIVAASLLSWRQLAPLLEGQNIAVAGHSVGEFAAAAIAGIITPEEAMRLVGLRGKFMAEAAAKVETSMAAVVGGKEEDVLAAITENGLTAANRNGGGQIVAAGLKTDIESLQANAPRGVRVIPLQVAGAFHTVHMASAVPLLAAEAEKVAPADPQIKIWSNSNGQTVSNGKEYLELLVSQIAQPVRWDLCMESFAKEGITGMVELLPAGALTGIAKRALRGTPTLAIKTPEDLEAATSLGANNNN